MRHDEVAIFPVLTWKQNCTNTKVTPLPTLVKQHSQRTGMNSAVIDAEYENCIGLQPEEQKDYRLPTALVGSLPVIIETSETSSSQNYVDTGTAVARDLYKDKH